MKFCKGRICDIDSSVAKDEIEQTEQQKDTPVTYMR